MIYSWSNLLFRLWSLYLEEIGKLWHVYSICTLTAYYWQHDLFATFNLYTYKQGTHDIQNVELDTGLEMVEISCHYADKRSTAVGCFMVALYWDEDTPLMFRAVHKTQSTDEETSFSVNGFNIKSMHFYEIRSNLFPGNFPADSKRLPMIPHTMTQLGKKHVYHTCACTLTYTWSLHTQQCSTAAQNMNGTILESSAITSVTVTAASNQICVACNGSTPSCVSVYHMCLDDSVPTLSIGYTSKTNIHQKVSKACFHVTSGCYWVAVFYLKDNDRMEEYPAMVKMIQVKSRHTYTHCDTASIQWLSICSRSS